MADLDDFLSKANAQSEQMEAAMEQLATLVSMYHEELLRKGIPLQTASALCRDFQEIALTYNPGKG